MRAVSCAALGEDDDGRIATLRLDQLLSVDDDLEGSLSLLVRAASGNVNGVDGVNKCAQERRLLELDAGRERGSQ